jgi:hypothetical protein
VIVNARDITFKALKDMIKNPGMLLDFDNMMHRIHDRMVEVYKKNPDALPRALVMQFELEAFGGICPKCGTPWIHRKVKNELVSFEYWQPSCRCYPVCCNCGNYLLYEIESGIMYCTNCKYMPICDQIVEKTKKSSKTGKTTKKKERCGGRYCLSESEYFCDSCGHTKNFILRDDLIVPEIYVGKMKEEKAG